MSLEPIAPKQSYSPSHNEEYMNSAQKAHFSQILINWKATISENNSETMTRLQSDTSPMADVSDRASLEEEFSLTLRARDRERKLINKINAALERIATDDFGFCECCGDKIGIQRLEARPTAELCIDCKELDEKKEIQVKGRR